MGGGRLRGGTVMIRRLIAQSLHNYWFPKAFGFTLDERFGHASFWCWLIGFYSPSCLSTHWG